MEVVKHCGPLGGEELLLAKMTFAQWFMLQLWAGQAQGHSADVGAKLNFYKVKDEMQRLQGIERGCRQFVDKMAPVVEPK